MMPGDSQAKTMAIAADATVGNCQNCSVLHQTLTEYVSSFLALKQKIMVSGDAIRLQQEVGELQVRLATLEKKTADYESVQAELEEKKRALVAYGRMSEEMEKLKQENSKALAENKKLEEQLKDVKELTETQSLENARLKREKAEVENDLLKTQTSLKNSQAQADRVEKLMEEKTTGLTNSFEKEVKLLEDSVCKQNRQISQLTKEKILLERNIHDLQVRLLKLERERNKDYRSISTQANPPREPKVDKEKVRMLLEGLWACVEPQQERSANLLHLAGDKSFKACSSPKQVPPCSPQSRRRSHPSDASPRPASHGVGDSRGRPAQTDGADAQLKQSPRAQKATGHQAPAQSSGGRKQRDAPKKSKRLCEEDEAGEEPLEKILELFRPLLPCISPVPDLDTEMETMETDDVEKENHPNPPDAPLQQETSSLAATSPSNHCPSLPALPAEGGADPPVVTVHEEEHTSNDSDSKDLGRSELSGGAETEDKGSTGVEDVDHPQRDPQTEQQPASAAHSPSSPTADSAAPAEVVSATGERPGASCGADPCGADPCGADPCGADPCGADPCGADPCGADPSGADPSGGVAGGISESGSALGKAKEDRSEAVTAMDVDTSLCDDADAKTAAPDGDESPRGGDDAVASEEAGAQVTSSPFTDPAKDAETSETENGPGVESSLTQDSEGATLSLCRDTAPEHNPCASSSTDGARSASSTNVDERLGDDGSIKPLEVEDTNEEQRSVGVDTAPPAEPHGGGSPPSPQTLFNVEVADEDRESADANVESPSKRAVATETLDSEMAADCRPAPPASPETPAVNCDSVKENPSRPLPAVKPRDMETQKAGVDAQHSSTNETSAPAPEEEEEEEEEGAIEKAAVEDLPQDGVDASGPASLSQTAVDANGQNKCASAREEQSPRPISGEESNPAPAPAPPPEFIGQLRSEMGPPLPPLLTPLSTPPKSGKSINPRQAIGKLSFPSPMERPASPATPLPTHATPGGQHPGSPSLDSPLPPNGVPSSPLQFGSATPKHAVPVPGRLPVAAAAAASSSPSSSSSPSQENSMRMLDTMYPELSARARTLSILRGNVGLGICASEGGASPATTDGPASGFKTVNSASTAFTKAEARGEKRQATSLPQPQNSKCPRLDGGSSAAGGTHAPSCSSNSGEEAAPPPPPPPRPDQLTNEASSRPVEGGEPAERNPVAEALKKIENQCFDLLPVLQCHLHVGNLPKKPVLRDEEKEVVAEICQSRLLKADDVISAILEKLKSERRDLSGNYVQALCRVYTGVCRQRGLWEKAHILAYSILVEDFPDSAKLILFMVTTWPSVLSHSSPLCRAIHTVTRLKAQEELLGCLSAFLGWEKSPPCDIDQLISATLSDIRSGANLSFAKHSRHGDDLGAEGWGHVYTLQLLCAHKKWKWTYEHLLGKELWPLMNTWVTQSRDQQGPVSDAAIATVLRLIGRLSQLGIKERSLSSVGTVATVINTFGRHGQAEGVPWEVQLAAVYCIYDLSPCNPKQAMDALAGWRAEASQRVPPAVMSCINQLASICRQVKN